jgi:hypothetical protein
MEAQFPVKEIKIMDGVYIWKPESKIVNKTQNNKNDQSTNNNSNQNKAGIGENNYLCHSKEELIRIYESEFEELGNVVQALFQSNEEMLEYDPHDYDLIQAREENLQIIDKKLEEMQKIQEKMKGHCNYHPIVSINVFEYFGIGKKEKDENINKEKDKDKNIIRVNEENTKNGNDINSINDLEENKEYNSINNDANKDNKTQNNDNLVTEIEL